jgi:hypothetical protein
MKKKFSFEVEIKPQAQNSNIFFNTNLYDCCRYESSNSMISATNPCFTFANFIDN